MVLWVLYPNICIFCFIYLVLFQRKKTRGMDQFRFLLFVLQNYGACFKKRKGDTNHMPSPTFYSFSSLPLGSCFLCVMHIIAVTNKLFLDVSKQLSDDKPVKSISCFKSSLRMSEIPFQLINTPLFLLSIRFRSTRSPLARI